MSSLFADTHNMVAILAKSDDAEGFEQIIDFLGGCYIHYALTVNPHIYVSCIKQFWNTASVKHSDDITRRVCLPNEEIFAGLAQMGYEKASTKLTFYKAFFSSQWKFLIHTLLQSLSTKRTSWNEFSSAMASAEIVAEDVANESIPSTPTPLILPSLPSHDILSTSQVQSSPPQQPQSSPQAPPQGAEFPTHLFQQVLDTCSALTRRVENLEHDRAAQKLEIIKLKVWVKRLERANKVKSSKLRRLKKVRTSQRIESSDDMKDVFNQGMMIDDLDKDEGIELAEIYHLDLDHPSKVLSMQEDDLKVQEVVEVVTTAKLITEVVTAATSQDQIELDAEYARKLHEEINKDREEINKDIDWDTAIDHVKQKSKEIQYIKRYQVMKKRPQTESEARKNMMIYLKNTAGYKLDFFKGMSYDEIRPIFQARFDANMSFLLKTKEEMEEEDREVLKSINETPAQKAAKRRMLCDRNTAGYKLDFFKGMSYDEICPIFQARFDTIMRFLLKSREEMEEEDREVLKSINETPAQKAAKRRKLNEEAQEVEDLKKHLEVVNDEDDDVFTKAIPLARKLLELMMSKRSRKNTKCINAADEELTAAKHKLMLLIYYC
nr:hypothetical protein [Tanacetum cinerariifolium]